MTGTNVFAGYGSVVQGDRLVGREYDVARLVERLEVGSVALVGPRRIGKSSVASEAARRIKDHDPAVVVWGNCATAANGHTLLGEMMVDLLEELQTRAVTAPDSLLRGEGRGDPFRALSGALKVLNSRQPPVRTVFVLDEFDALRRYSDGSTCAQKLRELIYHRHRFNCSMLFVCRRSLASIEDRLADVSNLAGICETVFLKPLDAEGATALVGRASPNWVVSDKEQRLLDEHTGGHPFLMEMILCKGWDARSEEVGFRASKVSILEYYRELQEDLRAEAILDDLVQLVVGPRLSVGAGARERLEAYGLVGLRRGGLAAWSKHAQSYFERISRDGTLWEEWAAVERALRERVASECEQRYGAKWLETISKRNSVGQIVGRCQQRRAREEECFGSDRLGNVLEYTYPDELWQIMVAEWEVFRGVLKRNMGYWSQRFGVLARVRNPVAHNREEAIPQAEILLARAYCKEILDTLLGATPAAAVPK